MKNKNKKNGFNVKKAKDYYSANEHSYNQNPERISERGIRSNLESQIQSSYGESATKNDLSKLVSSKESSGSEYGGAGLSTKEYSKINSKNNDLD
ncbi:MAG: hypothetical protein ACXVLQ_03530 [Bacteriovorax sp.]